MEEHQVITLDLIMGQHMHSNNTQDTYIYSEADETIQHDKAIIESNQFTAQQVMVNFNYHMYE